MGTSYDFFASMFMKEKYPTMGLAPSANIAKTGNGLNVQEGGTTILRTGQAMWSRIASAVPFGFTLDAIFGASNSSKAAVQYVVKKTGEGVQAVDGAVKNKVQSIGDTLAKPLSNLTTGLKWGIIVGIALIAIFLIAQFKNLVRE